MPFPSSELAYWGPGSDESVRDWPLEIKCMMSAHRTLVELSGAAAGSFDGYLQSRLAKKPHMMPTTTWNQWKWMIIYDGICFIARYLEVQNPLPFFWYNSDGGSLKRAFHTKISDLISLQSFLRCIVHPCQWARPASGALRATLRWTTSSDCP